MLDKVIYISRLEKNTQLAHNRADMIFYWPTALVLRRYWNLHSERTKKWTRHRLQSSLSVVELTRIVSTKKKISRQKYQLPSSRAPSTGTSERRLDEARCTITMDKLESFSNILEMAGPKLTDAISPANERIQTMSRFSTSAVSLILLLGRTKKLLEFAISRIL